MENNTNTPAMQQDNPTPGENGGKLFSQDEVNRIVQTRLAEERAKQSNPTEREQALTARESRLTCREYLMDIGASAELLDVLDTSDPERFKANIAKVMNCTKPRMTGLALSGASNFGSPRSTGLSHEGGYEVGRSGDDKIGEAFKADRRYRRT